VVDLEREQDTEILRQAARLLEAENRRLVQRVMELTTALLQAQGKDRALLQLEIEKLQAELEKKNKMLFGKSSERRADEDEAETKPKTPKRGHGPREQTELRLVVEEHELDASDRTCTACGGALEEMGQAEESEEIDIVTREFVRKKHVRKKYRCRCGACIKTAPTPARLVPGGRYSLAFAIAVAISKYADHRVPRMRVRRLRAKGGAMLQS